MSALHANECRETGSDLPRKTSSRTSDKPRGVGKSEGRKMTDTVVRQIKRCQTVSRTKKDEKRLMICVGEMSALHANECRETGSDLPRKTSSRTSDKPRDVGKSEGRKMTDTVVRQIKRCQKVSRTKKDEKRLMICVGEMSALHANECRETGSDLPRKTSSRTSDKSRGVRK
jgi:polyhydroxyalkanoate synthesis regulator phasin